MKINTTHYNELARRIKLVSWVIPILEEHLKQDTRVKDFSMRLRWDLFYMVSGSKFACEDARLYDYLNDNHIDTALKSIVNEINHA